MIFENLHALGLVVSTLSKNTENTINNYLNIEKFPLHFWKRLKTTFLFILNIIQITLGISPFQLWNLDYNGQNFSTRETHMQIWCSFVV